MATVVLCPACKTELKVIYYQRRAADEPPDKVTYCDNCPVDTTRLSISPMKSTYVSSKTVKSSNFNSTIHKSQTLHNVHKQCTRFYVTVKGRAAVNCYNEVKKQSIEKNLITAVPIHIVPKSKPITAYYYLTSKTQNESLVVTDTNILAPFVVCKEMDIYTFKDKSVLESITSNKVILGYEYQLDSIGSSSYAVLRTLYDGQKPYIFILLSDMKSNTVLNTLTSILVNYGTELSIKSFMSNTLINTLFIQSGKAYDWPSAPNDGYTYAWKPDGERFWYIKYGSVWIFSRRLLSGRIIGWNIGKSVHKFSTIGPILDIELMIGHDPIFIDLLADTNSQPMPVSRTLDSVLDHYNTIKEQGAIDVPIHIREYYRSDKDLLNTKDRLDYPVDGIVGIQDGSMTIIKLKDKKSIELELTKNGDLTTSDGHVIATSQLHETEEVGSIIEIRFEKESSSDTPTITEVFTRTDKTKANDMQACINIMNSISDTPDTLARRNVVQWCNSIRYKLNQVASKITGKGRIILDIGAGDGQAISDYSNDPEVTYLLLEPNEKKCKSMFRRLQDLDKNNARLFHHSTDVLNALRLLITKKVKYVVLCASLKSILDQKDCIRTLKTCIRCCIASLSISYIVDELHELAIEGLDVIGFGYMYDLADSKGVLINEYGVMMKLKDNESKDAIVKWGTDIAYTEKAIVLDDFDKVFYCKLAKNKVPTITESKVSLLSTVSSRVYIITTAKYII